MVTTLADMDGNETFDAGNLGSAEEVRSAYRVIGQLSVHLLQCSASLG